MIKEINKRANAMSYKGVVGITCSLDQLDQDENFVK